MIVLDDVLISDDLREKKFTCNLKACKGVCCIEGDGGAPLELEELQLLDKEYEKIKPYLTAKGIETIEKKGKYVFEKDDEYTGYGTPLIGNSGACAYVNFNENGISYCGIEKAYEDKAIDFQKPISCHLYPIRIKEYEEITAVNYEVWDICEAACKLGEQLQMPVYQFCKTALIRKFGEAFYSELEIVMQALQEEED